LQEVADQVGPAPGEFSAGSGAWKTATTFELRATQLNREVTEGRRKVRWKYSNNRRKGHFIHFYTRYSVVSAEEEGTLGEGGSAGRYEGLYKFSWINREIELFMAFA